MKSLLKQTLRTKNYKTPSIKKPMTERAVKILINKLPRLSTSVDTQIRILEQSIINNWTDIYPVKSEIKQQDNFTTIY